MVTSRGSIPTVAPRTSRRNPRPVAQRRPCPGSLNESHLCRSRGESEPARAWNRSSGTSNERTSATTSPGPGKMLASSVDTCAELRRFVTVAQAEAVCLEGVDDRRRSEGGTGTTQGRERIAEVPRHPRDLDEGE